MRKVKVHWMDTIQDASGWVDLDEYDYTAHEEAMLMETVGFLMNVTDKSIFVAQSVGNNQVTGVTCIPFGCILSIRRMNNG